MVHEVPSICISHLISHNAVRNTDIYCPILKNWPVYGIIIVEARERVRFSGFFVLFSSIPKDITGNLDKGKK